MIVKLLTEHHLTLLSLTEGCTGSSESTLVKMPHCWKSHVAAHFCLISMFAKIISEKSKVGQCHLKVRIQISIFLFILYFMQANLFIGK